MRNLFKQLGQALAHGTDAVLVTVVASSGSTPRGAGARMLVTDQGRLAGTIGGGAVEFRSQQLAQELLRTGCSRLEHFQLHENQILDLGMVCGGDVHVYFRHFSAQDPAASALVHEIETLFHTGEQCWLITEITPNQAGSMSVYGGKSGVHGAPVPDGLINRLSNRSAQISLEGNNYYCEQLVHAGRVYIFGGGHVAQELVPALAAVNFRCVVLEDRAEFCTPALFPGAQETLLIQNDCIADYVTITEDDYVAVMTRGHKDDLMVQSQILNTPACYIGVIGSRQKTKSVFARLKEMGFTDQDLSRITTPIGLDIKAETPAEIAVSIAAQLILHRAARSNSH